MQLTRSEMYYQNVVINRMAHRFQDEYSKFLYNLELDLNPDEEERKERIANLIRKSFIRLYNYDPVLKGYYLKVK